MAAAGLTPRVRLMANCDGVRESKQEVGVFHLKGQRQRIAARVFPFNPSRLWLFLLFSSTRPGEFPGYVLVINERTEKTVFYSPPAPAPKFGANDETLINVAPIECSFPEPGRYGIQIWFFQEQGHDVLKGELPFTVSNQEG